MSVNIFEVSTRVRHKLSGELMTIIRINETVVVCKRDAPIISKWLGVEHETFIAICHIENLELITDKTP